MGSAKERLTPGNHAPSLVAFLSMGETLQILPSHNPYSAGLQTSPPTALGITGERPPFCLPGWPGPWHAKNRIL